MLELADPHVRLQKKLRVGDYDIPVCTPNYRPPDVILGCQRFQEEFDMWSFGCLAAELYLRRPLIDPVATAGEGPSGKSFVASIAAVVGLPGQEDGSDAASDDAVSWLEQLPFFPKWYGPLTGKDWLEFKAVAATSRVPALGLQSSPLGLFELCQKCLKWSPRARLSIPEAKSHRFLQPPGEVPLHVRLAAKPGKHGVGTIAEASLDPDLLRYLQTCPSWNSLAELRFNTGAALSKSVGEVEAALGLKTEIAGIVDEENPPTCRHLFGDANLSLIPSERFAAFVRAIRRKWRPWLHQLGLKMREAVRKDGMPDSISQKNGRPILEEDFADNAFAYVSIQLMQPGARDDGWHTDGGCSLLHAGVTLFGTRSVEVKVDGSDQVTLRQKPGSFYVGNFAALEHCVRHHEDCTHTFHPTAATASGDAEDPAPRTSRRLQQQRDTAKGDRRLQIAAMIRSDVFRECRARTINAVPGPAEFFRVVNFAVARHLADVPVALPDLTEVLAEVARTGSLSGSPNPG